MKDNGGFLLLLLLLLLLSLLSPCHVGVREGPSSIIHCLLARLGSFGGKGNLVVWEVQVIAISSPIIIARFLYGGALFIVNVLFLACNYVELRIMELL